MVFMRFRGVWCKIREFRRFRGCLGVDSFGSTAILWRAAARPGGSVPQLVWVEALDWTGLDCVGLGDGAAAALLASAGGWVVSTFVVVVA